MFRIIIMVLNIEWLCIRRYLYKKTNPPKTKKQMVADLPTSLELFLFHCWQICKNDTKEEKYYMTFWVLNMMARDNFCHWKTMDSALDIS